MVFIKPWYQDTTEYFVNGNDKCFVDTKVGMTQYAASHAVTVLQGHCNKNGYTVRVPSSTVPGLVEFEKQTNPPHFYLPMGGGVFKKMYAPAGGYN